MRNLLEGIVSGGLEDFQKNARASVIQYDYSILAPQWLEQFERIMGENR